ncbi:MAG: methylated-DNA--[protein]-cysteine S-methyltransferase, partial [Rhodospirillaceae bacterium]|nr:methylated-DNA--[protein]-cysteine S-methyltransferase [Rhodospirillaceae bacterium]
MTITTLDQKTKTETIRFAIGDGALGPVLVATSGKGVCAILFGDDADALTRDLQDRFPKADAVGGDKDSERLAATVAAFIDAPTRRFDATLDIRGTVFQRRVWRALRDIPVGATASYADIAAAIGSPKAVRAVAGACAANALAVVIPCHRVVRGDGALSG